ncbi:hypothetical protein IW261DRAFT_1406352 [Armillaria novae-zelandiae]|uniref:Pyridoxamine 5'-phosphate oxidase N-terminal domain-containing protein n=1 Tax=Armillaria novae-zelandiae TaxID=153914 RepID=A0AA39U9P4_9AGAR|nr:hypothetical protein IW261DRAFT_1406352 [Armillaria novae-zelandiae]
MGKFYDEIPGYVMAMIKKQHMFWVATAPLSTDGHVNISSKGVEGTFHIIDSHTVWYEDLSGSGVETISHLRENGRITILFNAFEGPPSIVRLFGRGKFYEFGTSEYNAFIPPETRHPGSRAVIMIDVHKVGTSCGYAVPFYEFRSHRTRLLETAAKSELADIEAEEADNAAICQPPRPDDGLKQYWIQHNVQSIDGLPGMAFARPLMTHSFSDQIASTLWSYFASAPIYTRVHVQGTILPLPSFSLTSIVYLALTNIRCSPYLSSRITMGKFYDEIPGYVMAMIQKQHMFWVATAPLSADGHVNVSSKGVEGTFHIIDSHTVWYEDLSGSGVETISHLRENGRITILFNAFEGPPSIVRLFGRGKFYEFGTPEYNALIRPETRHPGSRAVIMIDVHKVGTSCGYAVPFYEFKSHRTRLLEFAAKRELADIEAEEADGAVCEPPRTGNGLKQYWVQESTQSIDGLPGMVFGQHSTDKFQTRGKVYKKDDENVSMKGFLEQLDVRFILGFSLGVAATAASNFLFYRR